MDRLQQAFYEKDFEIAFLRSKGDAFQTFFERLMSMAYKADFMACRPWGNRGDRKTKSKQDYVAFMRNISGDYFNAWKNEADPDMTMNLLALKKVAPRKGKLIGCMHSAYIEKNV